MFSLTRFPVTEQRFVPCIPPAPAPPGWLRRAGNWLGQPIPLLFVFQFLLFALGAVGGAGDGLVGVLISALLGLPLARLLWVIVYLPLAAAWRRHVR